MKSGYSLATLVALTALTPVAVWTQNSIPWRPSYASLQSGLNPSFAKDWLDKNEAKAQEAEKARQEAVASPNPVVAVQDWQKEEIKKALGEQDKRYNGTVTQYSAAKGHGFIKRDDNGKGIFVGINDVERAGLSELKVGQKVSFRDVTEPSKGRGARDLQLL